MKKSALIEALENSHESILNLIEGIPATQLEVPGAAGDWSVKDVLSHLLIREAETIKLLYLAKMHRKPDTAHFKTLSDDEQNKIWYVQFKDRPYQSVWNDYAVIRDQLLERIAVLSDSDLNNSSLFPWLKGQSLGNLIEAYILHHEKEYFETLKQWQANYKP